MDKAEMYAMSRFRLEKAKNDLAAAKATASQGFYDVSANRSYYAIFHAARAVLALTGQDFRKHSGVIAFFRKEYVKTDLLSNGQVGSLFTGLVPAVLRHPRLRLRSGMRSSRSRRHLC